MGHKHGRNGHQLLRTKYAEHPVFTIQAVAENLYFSLQHQEIVIGRCAFLKQRLTMRELQALRTTDEAVQITFCQS
ncbi:hypothetical protein D3C72_2378480 [compost metagenome]